MRVLIVEPNRKPYLKEINQSLNSYQSIVEGMIQAIYPYEDMVALVCNDEGKLNRMPLNRALRTEDGEIYDIVAGTFFICGIDEEDFCSLSDEMAVKYFEKFKYPEMIGRISHNEDIIAVKHLENDRDYELISFSEDEVIDNLLDRAGYKMMNNHSTLDGDKYEKEHDFENENILQLLMNIKEFDTGIIIKETYYDIGHRGYNKVPPCFVVKDKTMLDSFIERYDLKNGCDFGITPDGGLGIAIYGTGYDYDGMNDIKKVLLTIHPVMLPIDSEELYFNIPFNTYINIEKISIENDLKEIHKKVQKKLERKRLRSKSDRSF